MRDVNHGEVPRPDIADMVLHEGWLGLTGGLSSLRQILLVGAYVGFDAELPHLATKPLGAPQLVLICHLLDKGDGLMWDTRLSLL